MRRSIELAAGPSRLASLLLSYLRIPTKACAFVAPRQPGARTTTVVQGSSARGNADLVATLQLGLRGMSRTRSGVALFQKVDGRFVMVSAEAGGER